MSTSEVALLASVQQFLDRQHGLYLDGAQQAAESEKRLTVWNPATGQAIASTADASAADVDRAVMSAWRAFVSRSWAGRTPADRERILLRFADLVEQHGDGGCRANDMTDLRLPHHLRITGRGHAHII